MRDGEAAYRSSRSPSVTSNTFSPPPPPPTQTWSQPPPSSQRQGSTHQKCGTCEKRAANSQCANRACKKCCEALGGCQSVRDHRASALASTSSSLHILPQPPTISFQVHVAQQRTAHFDAILSPPLTQDRGLLSSTVPPTSPLASQLPFTPSNHSNSLQPRERSPIFFSDVTQSSKENTPAVQHMEYTRNLQRSQEAAKAAASYIRAHGWADTASEVVIEHQGAYLNGTVTVDEALIDRLGLQFYDLECFLKKGHMWLGIQVPYHVRAGRLPFIDGVPVVFLKKKGPDSDPVDAPGPLNSRREPFKRDLAALKKSTVASKVIIRVRPEPAAVLSPLSSKRTRAANSTSPLSAHRKGKKHRSKSPVIITSSPEAPPSKPQPHSNSQMSLSLSPKPLSQLHTPDTSIISLSSSSPSPTVKVKVEPKSPVPAQLKPAHSPTMISDSEDDGDMEAVEVVIPDRPERWPGSYFAIDIAWVFALSQKSQYQGAGQLEALFRKAFPGFPPPEVKNWPRANFFSLRNDWDRGPEEVKKRALKACRTPEGAWKAVYPALKGRQPKVVIKTARQKPVTKVVKKPRKVVYSSSESDWEDDADEDELDELA
ncbi:hypothetical protein BT96DRAFT_944345 [Gymnopus androsaceus JB14]|uniref:Uncharacterized protein n=1 Tax=Gymnopus androsaceus JB14 TaxID=1447944 RepID=A0A6A4H4T6_9AGAR|nr:hypothetical protein BT96DRAFT_944345 [Gymnopus androsaceus JB14]